MTFEDGRNRLAPKEGTEAIDRPAVKYGGEVFVGAGRHTDAMKEVHKKYPGAKITEDMMGFVTTDGEFVDLYNARTIAKKANQLTEKAEGSKHEILSSEDLKPREEK